ncbi:MAG TPA: c(7)-type cytochrome triheme domain-containing protein [Thermodesulfobacteriota bacterium]|nr:c(7)-type cytochrome triheme domain-containing protein [Thermodesulfobacteriota bacterium]
MRSSKYASISLLFSLIVFVGFALTGGFTYAESAEKNSKIDPADPSSVIYLDTSGKLAGTGDPTKPASMAYKAGHGWHPQALSAAGLPKDRYGLIDWAKLVREGVIKPKHSLDPKADELPPLQLDILILAKGDFVDDVIYPHEMHTFWLKCEVCHPKIFVPAKGQNNMTMVGIANGEWCGRCHNRIAFPLTDCKRCHTSPKKASK